MSYLRLFIELRKEDSGEGCGQVRVELQDWPGRVDCKVRCGLMGLLPGQTYEMALVCEQDGRYKEYPLGQFASNARGQAGPMFRGSFELEPDQISVTEFKAVLARSMDAMDGRIVGYRFEPMLIPLKYEEAEREPEEPEAEVKVEATTEPETMEETVEAEIETEILPEPSMPEEPAILQEPVRETEPTETPPAAGASAVSFAPAAIYVLRELRQVDLMCGDAGRRAFQRYRHLILAQQDKANYLGIPCRFRPSQRMELAEEGYTLFYTLHGEEPGFGEFGYWMKRL